MSTERGQLQFWWELRSCDYYDAFDRPKVIYQEIQFHPRYSLDERGSVSNNKTFFMPTADLYLLAVLNSPLVWWYNWRTLAHLKDEALSPAFYRMAELPVAVPDAGLRAEVEERVRRIIDLTKRRRHQVETLHDWLKVEFGIDKPGQRLSQPYEMSSDDFVAEVKRRRAGKFQVSSAELHHLRDGYQAAIVPMQEAARRALGIEAEISDLVNTAYGLTPDEVDLLWRTAPPRMPRVARLTEDPAEATQPAA